MIVKFCKDLQVWCKNAYYKGDSPAVTHSMIRLPERANCVRGMCPDSKETTWLFGILCYTACQRINSKGHSSDATIAVNTRLSVKDIARLKCSMNRKQTEIVGWE